MAQTPLPYIHLNAFMVRNDYVDNEFRSFLAADVSVTSYALDEALPIDGVFFVKNSREKIPKWAGLASQLTGVRIEQLVNKSSSAVLIIKSDGNIFAFTFGYGRFLIDLRYFISDFGIKTALNTLKHDSLKSVDLYTVQDQALQRRAQAVRASDIGVFGIDVSRDVLRAVTGEAKDGIDFQNISGGDAVYSFGINMASRDMPNIAARLANYYVLDDYKQDFIWVDNIHRLRDPQKIEMLDGLLLASIRLRDGESVAITIPEIIPWDKVFGFSFTRSKRNVLPILRAEDYLANVNVANVSVESIKADRLFVYDVNDNESCHSIYKCLYFEALHDDVNYVFFAGEWYEIESDFKARINAILDSIPMCRLQFPAVHVWLDGGEEKIEAEGDYNERAASECGYYLLDKRLVKADTTTTPIELCDMLTRDRAFIHVKHRKGGSAGLSHLFAQGNVAAEVMLGDRNFRIKARTVLRRVSAEAQDLLPLDGFRSSDNEIVYLVLGESSERIKRTLPFFSKVNLTIAYRNISQRGYRVSLAAVPYADRAVSTGDVN